MRVEEFRNYISYKNEIIQCENLETLLTFLKESDLFKEIMINTIKRQSTFQQKQTTFTGAAQVRREMYEITDNIAKIIENKPESNIIEALGKILRRSAENAMPLFLLRQPTAVKENVVTAINSDLRRNPRIDRNAKLI